MERPRTASTDRIEARELRAGAALVPARRGQRFALFGRDRGGVDREWTGVAGRVHGERERPPVGDRARLGARGGGLRAIEPLLEVAKRCRGFLERNKGRAFGVDPRWRVEGGRLAAGLLERLRAVGPAK